jgi:hypothetical protein
MSCSGEDFRPIRFVPVVNGFLQAYNWSSATDRTLIDDFIERGHLSNVIRETSSPGRDGDLPLQGDLLCR